MQQTIFIVGGAGYVGEMLCEQFAARLDVDRVITLDRQPQSDYSRAIPKLTYICHDMADDGWQGQVAAYNPTTVIHTAWQIRELYGRRNEQWRGNVDGSDMVFRFAFETPSVTKLIYFSTAASYAARPENTFEHQFSEDEGFRPDEYLYAKEKRVVEERLLERYSTARKANLRTPQIVVVRPAAITGPRGRYQRIRFGLQSALSGNMKRSFLSVLISPLLLYMPVTKGWVRQFIHEDDVTDAMAWFTFEPLATAYEVFNLTPDTEIVRARTMAQAVGKKILPIKPWMARWAFFFFWHATRGKIPTGPGVWRFYSYPIVMDGRKLAAVYQCAYSCEDAMRYTAGRYEHWVPIEKRKSKEALT